jgi:methyltransferase (TIGR00027 family)
MPEPSIQHISDTARWSAVFRARESERPNALFRDPYARRLAGDRGEQIAKATPFHQKNEWSWITRTYLFDKIIQEQVAHGVDMVVNLAAGLDARPYRMALPASLKWVEVDLPDILDYKESVLKNDKPVCSLQRISADLANAQTRRSLFTRLNAEATRALVISEGLLVYLPRDEVARFAQDLRSFPAFQRWTFDIVSPPLLKMLQKNTHHQFGSQVAPLQFAPEEGPDFFTRFDWKVLEVHSMLKTAAALKRTPLLLSFFALFPENEQNRAKKPWSGACLLGAE